MMMMMGTARLAKVKKRVTLFLPFLLTWTPLKVKGYRCQEAL